MENERRQLVLIGMMGAGKTTVGRLAAASLGWSFWDNDEALFQATRKTAAQLQHELGVSALHQTEDRLLREALQTREPTVYAAAGSVVLEPEILNRVPTIWLRIDAGQEQLNLARSGQYHRPLPRDTTPILEQLLKARAAKYERLADAIVDVASTPEVTCDRVIEAFKEMS